MANEEEEVLEILKYEKLEEESEEDQQFRRSILMSFNNLLEGVPSGQLMLKSRSSFQAGLSSQKLPDEDMGLHEKNTKSHRCLTQLSHSQSSIFNYVVHNFPELTDPGIDKAFNFVEAEQTFDNTGISIYKQLCKDMNIGPISRVIRSLNTDTLNLKHYGLSEKQFKAIAGCIMFNSYIKNLILGNNWITQKAALSLCEMLSENDSIKVLNLCECRLGVEGITSCIDGFSLNQSVREIDLSCNDLGDVGIQIFTKALQDNFNVNKLNLSQNNLGEPAGKVLGELLRNHANIDYLDLGWNDLFKGKALTYLFRGVMVIDGLKYLNLTWNRLCSPNIITPVVNYLKRTQKLQHIDLSFNGITGKSIMMLSAALKVNKSLKSINLGFNLITPAEAIKFISFLTPTHQLEYLDLQNIFVNKDFLPILQNLTDMGKSIRIEGVLDNYTIVEPDRKKIAFDRCRYLAQKPKKDKKDFGSDFIWMLPPVIVDSRILTKIIKKSKIKLNEDLVEFLGEAFSSTKKKINLKLMRETYLEMFPDTLPPKPSKMNMKKKKLVAEQTAEVGASSLSPVIAKQSSHHCALQNLSQLTKEQLGVSTPDTSEKTKTAINFEKSRHVPQQITIENISNMRNIVNSQLMKNVLELSSTKCTEGKCINFPVSLIESSPAHSLQEEIIENKQVKSKTIAFKNL